MRGLQYNLLFEVEASPTPDHVSGGDVQLNLGKLWGMRIDHLVKQPLPVCSALQEEKLISIINTELQYNLLYLSTSPLLNLSIMTAIEQLDD